MSKQIKLVVAGVLLTTGLGLLAYHFATRPPDPNSADLETIGKFVASERFGELSVEQRQPYIEALFSQREKLTPEVRDRLRKHWEQKFEEDEGAARRAMMTFGMSMMANEARKYHDMTPEQRAARIEQIRSGQGGFMFGGGQRPPQRSDAERRRDREQMRQRMADDDPEQRERMNRFMGAMLETSEPEDRAMMFNFFSDMTKAEAGR